MRPDARPLVTSRGVRLAVARGSMAYSAVTQPLPLLRRKGGTVSSTLAAQMTCVLPDLDQRRSFGGHQVVRDDFHWPHLAGLTIIRSHAI